jgi:putative ribosome biogenesis GTPase RsgA
MNGIYTVHIGDKAASYELNLKRKLTIIRGDSGTGKSSMLNLFRRKMLHSD